MAILARYASVSPAEFDEMHYPDSRRLAEEVRKIVEAEEKERAEFQLELTKAVIKSNGARL